MDEDGGDGEETLSTVSPGAQPPHPTAPSSLSSSASTSPPHVGVCRFALRALCTLLNRRMDAQIPERTKYSTALRWPKLQFCSALLTPISCRKCAGLLDANRCDSMTEAKRLLELAFFGSIGGPLPVFECEHDAKLFLDERRAHFVGQIVRWLVRRDSQIVAPANQLYLQFLLCSTPRAIFQTFIALRQR